MWLVTAVSDSMDLRMNRSEICQWKAGRVCRKKKECVQKSGQRTRGAVHVWDYDRRRIWVEGRAERSIMR